MKFPTGDKFPRLPNQRDQQLECIGRQPLGQLIHLSQTTAPSSNQRPASKEEVVDHCGSWLGIEDTETEIVVRIPAEDSLYFGTAALTVEELQKNRSSPCYSHLVQDIHGPAAAAAAVAIPLNLYVLERIPLMDPFPALVAVAAVGAGPLSWCDHPFRPQVQEHRTVVVGVP